MTLDPTQLEDMTTLALPEVFSSMHGPRSTASSSFSIPEVPSHALQTLSFKEAFSTYDYVEQISTLADLVTTIYESEGLE